MSDDWLAGYLAKATSQAYDRSHDHAVGLLESMPCEWMHVSCTCTCTRTRTRTRRYTLNGDD